MLFIHIFIHQSYTCLQIIKFKTHILTQYPLIYISPIKKWKDETKIFYVKMIKFIRMMSVGQRYRNVTAHLSHKEASPTKKKQKAFNFRMAKRTACNVTTLPGPLKGGDYAFLCALQQLQSSKVPLTELSKDNNKPWRSISVI